MKKSLEDIRHRYSDKSNDPGRNSTTSRSSNGHASNQAIKKDEPPPKSNDAAKTEAFSYPETVSQPSTADFSKIDFCSSVIAEDLGLLYVNETVGDIFSKSECNRASDHDPRTDAFQSAKKQTSPISNGSPKPLVLSFPGENMTQLSNPDFSQMGFSSSSIANNLNMVYTNESASKLFPGPLNCSASSEGVTTTTSHILKEQISETSHTKYKSMLLGHDEEIIDQSQNNFSSRSTTNDLHMLYTNESASYLFPDSLNGSTNDQGPPTTAYLNSNMQRSQTFNGESKLVDLRAQAEAEAPPSTYSSKNHSLIDIVANKTTESYEKIHQLRPTPLADVYIPSQFRLSNPNAQAATKIQPVSNESYPKLMFNQSDQFVKLDVQGPATNHESCGGNCSVLKNSVSSSLSDGPLTSEVPFNKNKINNSLPIHITNGNLGHPEEFDYPQCNNGHLVACSMDNCGTVADLPVLETSLQDERTRLGPQKTADSSIKPPHSPYRDEKSKPYKYERAQIFNNPKPVASSFEIILSDNNQSTNSSSVQKPSEEMMPESNNINENTQDFAIWETDAFGTLHNDSNVAIANEPPSEDGKNSYGKTAESNSTSISYCGFAPGVHSTFCSPESPPKHPQRFLSVIPEENQESDVVSQDSIVLPPTDIPVAVSTGMPVANDSNAINPEGSIGKSSYDGPKHETCSQSMLVTNSTLNDIEQSQKKYIEQSQQKYTYDDCRGNISGRAISLTAHDTFVIAPAADEALANLKNISHDMHGSCVDEPEICDLPTPKDYLEHNWFLQKISRLVLGTSGCCYEGEIYNSKMHGHGRFYFGKDQYIEGKWEMNCLIEPRVCLLVAETRNCTISVFKTLNTYLVSIFEYNIVAKAISTSCKELDFTASVADLKASFFGMFKVVDIIYDELRSKRDRALKEFKDVLKVTTSEDADVVKNATILFLLSKYTKYPDVERVLQGIRGNHVFPITLRAAATNLLEIEVAFTLRTEVIHLFACIDELVPRLALQEIMFNMYACRVTEHRRSLLSKCPNYPMLMETIQKLSNDKLVYVTREDVGVFHHLLSQPCTEHHETYQYIRTLFERFLEEFERRLQSIDTRVWPAVMIPLISPIFGYLFKSFSEIAGELVGKMDGCVFQDMLLIDRDHNWKINVKIRQAVEQKASSESISYCELHGAQYLSVFQMLHFFSPGNYIKGSKFNFKFRILKFYPSWWQQGSSDDGRALNELSSIELVDLEGMSNERLAWLFIVDKTVHLLYKDNLRFLEAIKLYTPLLQGYISFLQKSTVDAHESFRLMMHSIVQFLVTTLPYFTEYIDRPGPDFDVLRDQMWAMTTASRELEQRSETFTNFRDLVDEFNRYWTLGASLDVKTLRRSCGYFTNQICSMTETILQIVVRSSLMKEVPVISLIRYFRSLNDFLDDFKDIDFLSCWYVKSDIYVGTVMEKIDNKLSSSRHCSYQVTNIDGFIKLMERRCIPVHYILEVVRSLIGFVVHCLNSPWNCGPAHRKKSAIESLESTGMLLDAIRRSFLYLKEQPEYVDFETFKKESLQPFKRLLSDSTDLNDFKNRANTIKESFWYIRNMNEIGIDQAIILFQNVNDCSISDKLSDSYNLYLMHFNSFIETYCIHLKNGSSHVECLEAVSCRIKMTGDVHFSMWTEDFKTKEIPMLLAGLSAVWSILVSKDVSSTGKFLKPHCIQVLCILRLLSIDEQKGVQNHLAQVSTGQGKSLILGLLSSVLALTGHKVRIVCYSKYLSARDENDFKEFFQQFGIADKVSYGTFQDMANGFLKPLCNGRTTNLRKMVREKVMQHTDWVSLGSVKTESSDTILLIDEVDVFFNDQFYGNYYDSLATVPIAGLALIQHEMWKIVKGSTYKAVEVHKLLEKHISNKLNLGDPLYQEWEAFSKKPGKFHLLVDDAKGESQIREYTNRSLVNEHLLVMAEDAILLGRSKEMDHLFKINEEGLVCMRNSSGQYLPTIIQSYQNTFAYFKLKGSDKLPSNYFPNVGYLLLKAGKISYARLPCHFPLIMGASGTLKDLSEYEKKGIDSYNIEAFSILPSFFGESSLKFNPESDFTCVHEEQLWLNQIYHKANGMVEALRAVLIFFDSDVRLNLFANEYKTKFGRLNEITSNTHSGMRDLYINEAGIARTVTLANRVMGRGVDYKSSLSVEKKGGIHVIQTFFSVDVKEEIQIRGRTARKDNKGSYELVICKEHLVQKGIIRGEVRTEHTYSSLQPIRRELMDNIGRRHAEKVMKSEHNHETTMMYYGLSQFDKTISEASIVLGNWWKCTGAEYEESKKPRN